MQSASDESALCASGVTRLSLNSKRTGASEQVGSTSRAAQRPSLHSWPEGQSASVSQVPSARLSTHLPYLHFLPPGHLVLASHSGLGTHLLSLQTKPGLQLASVAHSWHWP